MATFQEHKNECGLICMSILGLAYNVNIDIFMLRKKYRKSEYLTMASMISELESHHVLVNGYFSDEIDKIIQNRIYNSKMIKFLIMLINKKLTFIFCNCFN